MADGTIFVKTGQTLVIVGVPADAPVPPYVPPANWSPNVPTHPIANPWPPYVDAGFPMPQPPWPTPPNWRPEHPEHPIANPWPPYVDANPPQPQPPVDPTTPPPNLDNGNWTWAWSPQAGRWVWVKVPGEGEAGPKKKTTAP